MCLAHIVELFAHVFAIGGSALSRVCTEPHSVTFCLTCKSNQCVHVTLTLNTTVHTKMIFAMNFKVVQWFFINSNKKCSRAFCSVSISLIQFHTKRALWIFGCSLVCEVLKVSLRLHYLWSFSLNRQLCGIF